jgi:predicted TPR repeat methyltransferase
MLEKVDHKNLYSKISISKISQFLENQEKGLSEYLVILANDVFVYIGNLEGVFTAVRPRLKENGVFLFTVEKLSIENYMLQRTGHYSHSKTYIQFLAQRFVFKVLNIQEIVPRKDGDEYIQVYMVSLKKPKTRRHSN